MVLTRRIQPDGKKMAGFKNLKQVVIVVSSIAAKIRDHKKG